MLLQNCGPRPVSKRLARLSALLCLAGLTASAIAYESDPKVVDQSVAWRIGDHQVSQYIVDKNYNFYLAGRNAAAAKPVSQEQQIQWFRTFLARQGLVAKLRSEGNAETDEVRKAVDQMGRYIITQGSGPLYSHLFADIQVTPEQVAREFPDTAVHVQGSFVKFDDATLAETHLGYDFAALSPEAKAIRIASIDPQADCDHLEGELYWPFSPFQELRHTIANATPGSVTGLIEGKLGVYAFAISSVERAPMQPSADPQSNGFAAHLQRMEESIASEQRARKVLAQLDFQIEEQAVEAMASVLGQTIEGQHMIAPEMVVQVGSSPLARYREIDGTEKTIQSQDLAEYFNALIIRSLPRTPEQVAVNLQDLVMQVMDMREAKAKGFDRDPRFVEDKRNFEDNQIIYYYEQRTLAPQIEITDGQIKAFYEANKESFTEIKSVTIALRSFESQEAAFRSMQGKPDAAPVSTETAVIRRNQPNIPLPIAPDIIFNFPVGQPIGPFQTGERSVLIVRQGEPKIGPITLEDATESIRQNLLRAALDQKLAELPIPTDLEDHIDYTRYGLLFKPYTLPENPKRDPTASDDS